MTKESLAPIRTRLRARLPSIVGVLLAGVAVALFYRSGSASAADEALQVMGFDPDRARLLTAFMSTALAASIVAFAGAPTGLGVLAGLLAGGLTFGHTFLVETRGALASHGLEGRFDAWGWVLSTITLVVTFCLAGAASAILAREIRKPVVAALATIRDLVRRDRRALGRARLAGIAGVFVSIVVVVTAMPVLGDMLNIDPDVRMRGAPAVPTVLGSAQPQASGAARASATPVGPSGGDPPASGLPAAVSVYPAGLDPGPLPASLITPGAISSARPWLSTLPSGKGSIVSSTLPAPWTGGSSAIEIGLYLPPGYDLATTKYPVIYTAPESGTYWNRGMRLRDVLDVMITSGQIPPEIVVFASSYGGPYVDSECADSVDGREWFDRFLATDLVHWVDSNYRTIPTPAARATLGFSQGAYCAAAMVAHHPDVFGSAMVVSGYFLSGMKTGTTPNAWRPFNGDPVAEAAASPMSAIARLPKSVAASLFYVMEADPNNPVYGTQMAKFSAVLHDAGASLAIIPTSLGHSWKAAGKFIPVMLTMVAGRMVHLGVFTSGP